MEILLQLPTRLAVQCTIVGACVKHSSRGNVPFSEYHCTDDTNWRSLLSCQQQWIRLLSVVANPKSTVQYPNYRRTCLRLNRSELFNIIFTTFKLPMDNWRLCGHKCRPDQAGWSAWRRETASGRVCLYKHTECCWKDADTKTPGSVSPSSPQISRELASNLTRASGD